jgi:hypothetical protein
MKRALLVGIDHYQKVNPLAGCVNDVRALEPLISRHDDESLNFECVACVSSEQTVDRNLLLENIDNLLAPGADVALLYFAGHGMEQRGDVVLVSQEAANPNEGVAFSLILGKVQDSPVREIIIILDCCFSGGAGGVPALGADVATLREGLALFSASRADQTAAETANARGMFSSYFCGALEGGAADVLGNVSLAGTYAYLSESFGSWGQRPTFKANLERSSVLRESRPSVARKELRQLPVIFSDPNADLPLTPRHESASPDHDPKLAPVMSILQRCRSARLVEPVGTEHLFKAAMESKACRLTPLGKHYWRMAKQNRL